ncbi:MAG: amidohydrolase family protein [Sedimentisphaeraceae bacterium JB056]
MKNIQKSLYEYIKELEIIDTHEHLVCEKYRLERNIDIFTLMHLYEYVDMTSAGYKPRNGENVFVNNLFTDESVDIDEKWKRAWPHLQNIKYGSYYRPTKILLKDLYGVDDLNETNYKEVSEKINNANKKGLYKRILRDKCNIKYSLVQNGTVTDQDPADIFVPLFADVNSYQLENDNFIRTLEKHFDSSIEDLDTYTSFLCSFMEEMKKLGAAGFKIASNYNVEPNIKEASNSFKKVLKGEKADVNLQSAILDSILKKAAELDWPVAVHCGVWWDYRTVDPKNMIDLIQRHTNTRFDLYHLGIPDVRDTIFLGKNFPNVFLNLCWTYLVSQSITENAINEIIDTVPVNKIFAFGADSCWSIEQVYGHYIIAAETLSRAFAKRIDQGLLEIDDAKHILKMWLYDNPVNFYKL